MHDADPRQPISNVQSLADVVASQAASRTSQRRVLEILAAIALLLATVGIHGLLSFAVSKRHPGNRRTRRDAAWKHCSPASILAIRSR